MGHLPPEAPRCAARRVRKHFVTSRRSLRAYAVEPLERRMLLSVPATGPEIMAHPPRAGADWTIASRRAVASDALGNSVAVWESDVGSPGNPVWQVQGQRFDPAGARVGPVFGVTPPTHSGPFQPDVAMDAAGGFVVAWKTERNGTVPYGVFFQRFDPGASPAGSATVVIFDQFGTGQFIFTDPSVALDADGDFSVAFEIMAPASTVQEIGVVRYSSTGEGIGNFFVDRPNASDELLDPVVVTDADGNLVVLWRHVGVFGARLEGRRFSATGVQQGGDFEVAPYSLGGYGAPQAAMDDNGDFVVVWDEPSRDGSDLGVYARRFNNAAVPFGPDFLVNTATAGDQRDPRVAMSAGGEFVIVWNRQGLALSGQYFDAGGARDGGEFQLATGATPFPPSSASVAMDGDGDFSAVWTALGGVDVYARRFARPSGRGTAQGRKVHDLNADGVPAPSEPGLGGWTIYHDANNNGVLDSGPSVGPARATNVFLHPNSTRRLLGRASGGVAGQVVDLVNVTINFQHPRVGDLVVTLISPAGRRAELFSNVGGNGANFTHTTFDDAALFSITAAAAPFTGTYRTEQQPLSIFNGEVLDDAGYWMLEVQNSGAQGGIAIGWSLSLRSAEPMAFTNSAGNYLISLPAGVQTIAEVQQSGYAQTFPIPRVGSHTVNVTPNAVVGPFDFANAYAGVASGTVFHDLNANGVADPSEPSIPTWRVFYDANANGQFDPTEPSDFSHEVFGYSLGGLPLSSVVTLGVIPAPTTGAPWELSTAPAPFTAVHSNPGKNFGAFKRGTISGVSFNDLNSNGVREPSEPALAGTRVFLDQDADGAYDDGLPFSVASTDVPKSFDFRTGAAVSRLTLAGVSRLVDVDLTLSISMPTAGAITATLTNPDGDTAPLFEEFDASSGDLVAATFDDEADVAFTDARPPFDKRYRPSGELRTVLRGSPNGVWTLTVSGERLDRFGAGVLSAWSLGLTSPAEPSTLTGANGGYEFASLVPGPYRVGAVVAAPWVRTAPPGVHTVDLTSGQDLAGLDFGQFDPTAPPPTRVMRVYAGGPQLMPGGNAQFLAAAGIGTLGYPVPGGAGQLRPLPWTGGIDRVAVQFDRDVSTSLDETDLRLHGVARRSYEVLSFKWDGRNMTATWEIAPAVFNDKLQIELLASRGGVENLDGEWTNPAGLAGAGSNYPSGDGYAGGDFRFSFNVLAGDATGDGAVNVRDLDDVRRRHGRTPGSRAEGRTAYSVFADVTGDAAVNALDLIAVRQQLMQELPIGVIRASAAVQAPLAGGPSATRELLASRRTVFN